MTRGKEQIMVLGHDLELPFQKDLTADQFVQLIEDKRAVYYDLIDSGFSEPWEIGLQDGNPWLFGSRMGQKFPPGQKWGDTVLLQVSEKEAKFMHTFQLIGLLAAWKALENSGVPTSLLHKTRTGIFVAGTANFGNFESYPDETSLRGSLNSSLADRISYFLGTHGPSVALETACSSSLTALTLACNAIKDGSCEVALLVGININNREYELALQAAGVISKKGQCLPFDKEADGTVRCEGYGCIVLASQTWTMRNKFLDSVKCQIVNATMGSAGAAPTARQGSGRVYEQPNAQGMAEMIRLCHQQAGLPLGDIKYVEAHATGTPVGDLIELEALGAVYKDSHDLENNPLRIGSVKGNLGHAEISAGLFSLIKAIEMIQRRRFLPTGGANIRPRSDFDWDGSNMRLCLESESFPPESGVCISVNSFGVGGAYAHAILAEVHPQFKDETLNNKHNVAPAKLNGTVVLRERKEATPLIFSVSAASIEHLDVYERNLASFFEDPSSVRLLDVCGCFAINRTRLPICRNYLVNSVEDLGAKLRLPTEEKPAACERLPYSTVAFVFTGQGSQWVTMGAQLMVYSAYKETVMKFDKAFSMLSGWSPAEMLCSLHEDEISNTMYAQPLTCMVQMGLTELLRYFGVRPMAVIGHSAGEIPAMWCCGVLSMEQAASIIYHRSCCQQEMCGNGRMLAVQMSDLEAEALLHQIHASRCSIACVNSPTSVVIAGPTADLDRVRLHLPHGCKSTFLKGSTAFHSSLMDPCLPHVQKRLQEMRLDESLVGNIPIISTVTGDILEHMNVQYFLDNIRQPVKFLDGIRCLEQRLEPDVIVEIGPHKTLIPAIVQSLGADSNIKVLETLIQHKDDLSVFLQVLVRLMSCDVQVDLSNWYTDLGYTFSKVMNTPIPTHPLLKPTLPDYMHLLQKKAKFSWNVGPAVGNLDSDEDKNLFVSEISQATCPTMMSHVMGGQAILPGMFFVEAVLEAWCFDKDPDSAVVMEDVAFESMCPIPNRSKDQNATKLLVRKLPQAKNGLNHFVVESKPMFGDETTAHCTGSLASFNCSDMLNGGLIPGRKGFLESRSGLHDLKKTQIQEIWDAHTSVYDHHQVYKFINKQGMVEYGEQFQVIKEARIRADRKSIIASLHCDHEEWSKKGGHYPIPMLDGILQLGFLNSGSLDIGCVMYAGGFELGYFARRPKENACIALMEILDPVPDGMFIVTGNAWLYDMQGNLLVYLEGIRCILGNKKTQVNDILQIWQPVLSEGPDGRAFSMDRCTQNIASLASKILHKKHQMSRCNIATLRMLEYIEDQSQQSKVLESLLQVNEEDLLGAPLLIELFIATNNVAVAQKRFSVPSKRRNWLKVRLVCLPSARDMVLSLYRFDLILINETAISQNWQSHKEALLDIARLGHIECILLHDFDLNSSCTDYVSRLSDLGDKMHASHLLCESLHQDQPYGRDILILSSNNEASSQFFSILSSRISAYRSTWNIEVLELEDGDSQEGHMMQELARFATANPNNEKHVVILDGMYDTSKYAQDSFIRTAKVAHSLGALLLLQDKKACIWICTSGVFSSTVNLNRCSLSSLSRSITSELRCLYAKHVDVEDPVQNLDALLTLLIFNAGGSRNLIDKKNNIFEYCFIPADIENVCGNDGFCIQSNDPHMEYRCQLFQSPESGMVEYDFFIHQSQSPGTGEVLVQVHASSLNFRDVMLSLNALPKASFDGSFYGRNLGMEASGIILQVGEGVEHLKVGDPVLVCEPSCFSSKLIAPAQRVLRIPGSKIDLLNAATLSSVYCTAYHALIQLANVQKGERVLVHAAAGGVGHAAISICQYLGAELYITASEGKQNYCATTFGISKSRIFNSRDTSWYCDLMKATNGSGVDVVINCLAQEHQRLGLESLKPGGRFCEIGKMDIFNNEALFLYLFRKNIAFFAIDMDRMNLDNPGKIQDISAKVFEHVSQGHFALIPYQTFSMDRLKDAIECMKSGAHIGKILLTNYGPAGTSEPVTITGRKAVKFNPDSIFFILGGAGGFGSRVIDWAYSRGARKFVTTARDPSRVNRMFPHLISGGATIHALQVDLTCPEDLQKVEHHLLHEVDGPVETLVHCAGIYEGFHFSNISDNPLERQATVKLESALFMHNLSLKLDRLKNFIIIGSCSIDTLAHFMATYSSSNAMLAGIARQRESLQLPVTILNMTSIKDAGLVQNDESTREFQERVGIEPISSTRALRSIETMLEKGRSSTLQFQYFPPEVKMKTNSFWFETHGTMAVPGLLVFGNPVATTRGHARTYEDILNQVIDIIQEFNDISDIGPATFLSSVGVDSFKMMEFGQQIQADFDYTIDPSVMSMTIGEIAMAIHKKQVHSSKTNNI